MSICARKGENNYEPDVRSRLSGDTEVLVGSPALARSPQEDSVGATRRTDGKLIESQALTASLDNAGTSVLCEPQRTDGEFGEFEESGIICDGADNDGDLALPLSLRESYEF